MGVKTPANIKCFKLGELRAFFFFFISDGWRKQENEPKVIREKKNAANISQKFNIDLFFSKDVRSDVRRFTQAPGTTCEDRERTSEGLKLNIKKINANVTFTCSFVAKKAVASLFFP